MDTHKRKREDQDSAGTDERAADTEDVADSAEQAEADGEEGSDDEYDDDGGADEGEQPWLFGVAEQLGVQELRSYIEYGDDVRVISLDSTCWPSAFAALIALRSQGLVNFENPDGGQPPQAECIQCMLVALRALCAKSTVIVVKTDARRRATVAVVGLLVRCIEAAYDEVLQAVAEEEAPQVVVVLTGWSQETLPAPAVVAGGPDGDMAVAQVDTSGQADDEPSDEGGDENDVDAEEEGDDEEDEEEAEGAEDGDEEDEEEGEGEEGEDDEDADADADDGEEEEEEEEEEESTWLYGTRLGITTAELKEVMEADDGVVFIELILSGSAGVVGEQSSGSSTGVLKWLAERMHASLQQARDINGRHAAALRRCASDFGSISTVLTALLEEQSLVLIVRGKPSDAYTTAGVLALLECLDEAQTSEDASQLVVVLVGWVGEFCTVSGPSLRPAEGAAVAEYETTDLGL